jgi:hypothetical protein
MPRVLPRTYAERDVADVESYVRRAVGRLSPRVLAPEHERLVARGILLVRRIAHALPPGASLERVLSERLEGALAVYRLRDRRLAREDATSRPPVRRAA